MQLPTIHGNGTSKDELLQGYLAASDALAAAAAALVAITPNGRDFYPQGPEAFRTADREHMERLRALERVKREIDAIALAIHETEG